MRIAFTHNLRLTDSEDEAEFDSAQTYHVNDPLRAIASNSSATTGGRMTNAGFTFGTTAYVGVVSKLPTLNSDKVNVIPSRATLRIDCRVPPGLGEDDARKRIAEVLGDGGTDTHIAFDETVTGNHSPVQSALMDSISSWVAANDPGAVAVPVILPGFSDSRWFRDAYPDCVAYGFFPQRHQSLLEAAPLVHNADERIDVRDLGFAASFYTDTARELLG